MLAVFSLPIRFVWSVDLIFKWHGCDFATRRNCITRLELMSTRIIISRAISSHVPTYPVHRLDLFK